MTLLYFFVAPSSYVLLRSWKYWGVPMMDAIPVFVNTIWRYLQRSLRISVLYDN